MTNKHVARMQHIVHWCDVHNLIAHIIFNRHWEVIHVVCQHLK